MRLLALIFLLLASAAAYSADVAGSLLDSATTAPLPNASVRLLAPDSSARFLTKSDENGKFKIESVPSGQYFLYVSFVGFATFTDSIAVGAKNVDVGKIYLAPLAITTESVEVVAEGPEGKQKGDTTEFSASAYYTDRNAMLEELLKKIPGVEIDRDGNITVHGEAASKLLIDGKPLFDNPQIALKNLPADAVKKISVYNSQDEKAEFAGLRQGDEKKTINIVTKNKITGGYYGNLRSVYSAWDRLDVTGNINAFDTTQKYSFNGGVNNGSLYSGASAFTPAHPNYNLSANYSNVYGGKLDFTGNANYSYQNGRDQSETNREFLSLSDSIRLFNQTNASNSENSNFKLNTRIKYVGDKENEALFNASAGLGSSKNISNNINENLYGSGLAANRSDRNSNNESNSGSFSADLSYKRKLDTTDHTIAAQVSASVNRSDRNYYYLSNDLSLVGGEEIESFQYRKTLTPSNGRDAEASLTYARPLGEQFRIKLNYEAEYSESSANKSVYDAQTPDYLTAPLDSSLSDEYRYSELTHRAGAELVYKLGDLSITANANYRISLHHDRRAFPYETELSYNYNSILPRAWIEYKIGPKSNLRLNYWTRSQDPNFSQLNSKISVDDPQYVYIGNPGLNSALMQRMHIEYRNFNPEKKTYIYANLSYGVTNDQIVSSTIRLQRDTIIQGGIRMLAGGQVSSPINLDGARSLGFNASYSYPWDLYSTKLALSLWGYLSRTPGMLNGLLYHSDSYNWGSYLSLTGDIDKKLEFYLTSRLSLSKTLNSRNGQSQYANTLGGNAKIKWTFAERYFVETEFTGRQSLGSSYPALNSALLNFAVGVKFFGNALELSLNAADVLEANNNEMITVNEFYTDRTSSKILSRYYSLNLIYNLSTLGGAPPPDDRREPGGRRIRF